MKIKNWIIHKLGGKTKEEIFPPIQYTVTYPTVEKFGTYFINSYSMVPEEYIIERLANNFIPMIKENMKVTKEIGYYGEKRYRAEISIVKDKI